jgi:hypothetical protein
VRRRSFLPSLLFGLSLRAQSKPESVRGKLAANAQGKPTLITTQGNPILPAGDAPTEGVLHDKRLLGSDMELLGHFAAPDHFAVDPIHTRSIFVHKDGKRLMVTYWCDVCAIRFYTPGVCWCCQEETQLDLRERDDPNDPETTAAAPATPYVKR